MFKNLTKALGLDPTTRDLNRYSEVADEIARREPQFQRLTDAELRQWTDRFKQQIEDARSGLTGDARHKAEREVLDEILIDAFALVRETSMRQLGLRHYDVQMVGGQVIHEGRVAEMRTGEGKTLVSTLPIYLNALLGRGVHLITVNDYLARRDARWMGPIYAFHGMSVGILQDSARTDYAREGFIFDPSERHNLEQDDMMRRVPRRESYAADITYGTNNEYGFDYLRDNMVFRWGDKRQRELHYAIIDEVDNILIDEARTPLIISGPADFAPDMYKLLASVVRQIEPEMYEIDQRGRSIVLNDAGYDRVEQLLGRPLRDPDRPEDLTREQEQMMAHLEQALRAEFLYRRDKEYVVEAGQVLIVDTNTGRIMPGRRWSDGLHQAVEAKEGVQIQRENMTQATITLQNFFRLYHKLAGMSGTAVTESEEFSNIYKMDVVPIPPNLDYRADRDPDLTLVKYNEGSYKFEYVAHKQNTQVPVLWRRKDYDDVIYRTAEAKYRSIMREVLQRHTAGQPLLIGTTSVELSELLSRRLSAELLKRLALVLLLRDAWFEANDRVEDGRIIKELEFLNDSLETLTTGKMRPLARELDMKLNPVTPENLARLKHILELEDHQVAKLAEVLEGGIKHNVLNAKRHTEESQIIADAGRLYGVTIATNMAGRGVDIKLGGELAEDTLRDLNHALQHIGIDDPFDMPLRAKFDALKDVTDSDLIRPPRSEDEAPDTTFLDAVNTLRQYMDEAEQVRAVGGLHVIGSERYEARRIDNQLRGRAGRQGDPGSSRFYLSLEDDLMRRFGGSNVSGLMERFRIDEALPLEHNMVNRSVEQSQSRVEGANFDARKHLLEYDDVLNEQRNSFYAQRDRILQKPELHEDIDQMLVAETTRQVAQAAQRRKEAPTPELDEGWWRVLDWVDKVQPIIESPDGEHLFTFSIEHIIAELQQFDTPPAARAHVETLARQALDAATAHMLRNVDESLVQTRARVEDMMAEQRDDAEIAFDGLLDEARMTGGSLGKPSETLRQVLAIMGLEKAITITREDRQWLDEGGNARNAIAKLIAGKQAREAMQRWLGKTGRALGMERLENEVPLPDWDDDDWQGFDRVLFETIEKHRKTQVDRDLSEISIILRDALHRDDQLSHAALGATLIRIALRQQPSVGGQRSSSPRSLQRLPYVFYVSDRLKDLSAEELTEHLLTHLRKAQGILEQVWSNANFERLAGNYLTDLNAELQDVLREKLGDEAFEANKQTALQDLPDDLRKTVFDTFGHRSLAAIHRTLLLRVSTDLWVDYLTTIEGLRTTAGLEAYAQRDPLTAYKGKAYEAFNELLVKMRQQVVTNLFRYRPARAAQTSAVGTSEDIEAVVKRYEALGRNDPCWCGSGKRYKDCHLDADKQRVQGYRAQRAAETQRSRKPKDKSRARAKARSSRRR